MVNFGVGPAFVLGIFLAVAGAGLYFLRSVRPELSRDHDIFFAAVGLVCGLILMFYGWRLEPALQFGQFLLTGTTIFFAYEAIKLRGIATEQARRSTPIVDEDRPTSKVYRGDAKLDDYEPYEERPRLQGTRNRRSDYESEERSPARNNRSPRPRNEESARTRRSRPAAPSRGYDDYSDAGNYEDTDYASSRSRRSRADYSDEPPARPRTRRSRSGDVSDYGSDYEAMPVDYQPIESEDEMGNGSDRPSEERSERPTRESRYEKRSERSRSSFDPMNYGKPYDDSEEDYDSEDARSEEEAEPRPNRDRFDY